MYATKEKIDKSFVVDDLNDLIHRHYDLAKSYEDVVKKAKSPTTSEYIQRIIREHFHHIENVAQVIRDLGGEPTRRTDLGIVAATFSLSAGKIFNDPGLIRALLNNENKLALEYVRNIKTLAFVPGVEPTLQRHYNVVEERVNTLAKMLEREER